MLGEREDAAERYPTTTNGYKAEFVGYFNPSYYPPSHSHNRRRLVVD